MELTTNKIDYVRNENGTYKLIAYIDTYENEQSTTPKTYILEMDNAKLDEDQLEIIRNSKHFRIIIHDFNKGDIEIKY